MQATLTSEKHTSTELPSGSTSRRSLFFIVFFAYAATFIAVYLNLSITVRFAVAAILILIQFFSFRAALVILFLALFMPFISDLLGEGVLRFGRLATIPLVFHMIRKPAIRRFPANQQVLLLALLSLIVIKVTADLQVIYQISDDPTHQDYNKQLTNYLADYFDIGSTLLFFYALFTKVTVPDIHYIFKNVLWAVTLQGLSIIYIAITNFNDLLLQTKGERILWDSPLFRHKQYWGPLFCLVFLMHLVIYFNARRKGFGQLFPMGVTLLTLFLSLSRTGYLGVIIGLGVFAVRSKNLKKLFYIAGVLLLLLPIALQIDFVNDRMESMVAADDVGEFQDQSAGHFSDEAMQQYAENFTIVPQMFFVPWEFNYSEGFWNGLLHQSGILGVLVIVLVFYRMLRRFNYLYQKGNSTTQTLAMMGIVFIPLFAIINTINRNGYFMDYYGQFTSYGLLFILVYLYAELTYREDVLSY